MASINISDLHPPGYDLFQDSESFLNELTEREMEIVGGWYNNIRSLTKGLTALVKIKAHETYIHTNRQTHNNTVGQTRGNKVGC